MKPYMIIEGNNHSIELFEQKVADALELGYTLAGELIAQPHSAEIKFFQPLIMDESDDEWEDDEDEEDEENED